MLELTKKPRTDGLWEICAVVPANHVNRVTLAIQEASEPSIPASEVFPESTPGSRLRGARGLMGLTQAQPGGKDRSGRPQHIGHGAWPASHRQGHGKEDWGSARFSLEGAFVACREK